jgi:NDP-sugar pyrophosphorylase family protein
MNTTLLVLAAGIGSRYGGVKQMDGIGPSNESIIDYSVFDAIRAGFNRIVFVVNAKIEDDFREVWEPKLKGKVDYEFVIQDPADLPEGFSTPEDRTKPWGTGQAVLAARHIIDTPFAVINADDFYGRESYELIHDFLTGSSPDNESCMVGYYLDKTLSEHGTVSRGVCEFDEDHYLEQITEITNIERRGEAIGYEANGVLIELKGKDLCSMNIWGFKPEVMMHLEAGFRSFLERNISNNRSEYYLPMRINDLVHDGIMSVKMLETAFAWFGVTYKEDKPKTISRINELIERGEYPPNLWKS